MEVNKKQLADIFGASIRTIQNWQEQGMPVLRGGGKGNEVLYDSAAVIKWYAKRDAEIENEKLRREVEELRQASEADLQPGTIEYERHRLTRAQADAQELKNARDSAEVVETAFCTFVLSRIPRLQCTAVRRPLMPDWLMNLSTAPMRSPLCVMHWMHVNPVSQEGE